MDRKKAKKTLQIIEGIRIALLFLVIVLLAIALYCFR